MFSERFPARLRPVMRSIIRQPGGIKKMQECERNAARALFPEIPQVVDLYAKETEGSPRGDIAENERGEELGPVVHPGSGEPRGVFALPVAAHSLGSYPLRR